jgi:predicted ATP-dependent endonuclease of OLD family
LFEDYIAAYKKARETEQSKEGRETKVTLYPQNLCEYLERNLNRLFEIRAFILDPKKAYEWQETELDFEVDEKDPFDGLIRIDMIDAQRGLADADSSNDVVSLSQQFRSYYDKHLDIEKATSPEDMKTLEALRAAKDTFDETLGIRFKGVIDELGELGYPGINDPRITRESKFEERRAFDHESAIHYDLTGDSSDFKLPEKYNGLGYQNLIAIVFRLISFRDARLQI